jgi:hypothetical protein
MRKRFVYAAWMLTPVVACAGAFLMGWLGAIVGDRLTWLFVGGLIGGLVAVAGWGVLLSYLQKKRRTQDEA